MAASFDLAPVSLFRGTRQVALKQTCERINVPLPRHSNVSASHLPPDLSVATRKTTIFDGVFVGNPSADQMTRHFNASAYFSPPPQLHGSERALWRAERVNVSASIIMFPPTRLFIFLSVSGHTLFLTGNEGGA